MQAKGENYIFLFSETPECLISGDLVAGQEVDLACRVRFGVGSSPEIRAEKYPKVRHYIDGIMSAMASQITGVAIVCLTVRSGKDQRNNQSSASLAFVRRINR